MNLSRRPRSPNDSSSPAQASLLWWTRSNAPGWSVGSGAHPTAGSCSSELTDAAYPVIDAYLADVTTLHAHEFAVLDEQERETFVRLLAKVAASIEALDVDAVVASARPRKRPRGTRR